MTVEPVRDPLERFYTPELLADAIVRHVVAPMVTAHDIERPRILMGSVGGGALVRAVRAHLPTARIHGNDIDPYALGLDACDSASRVDFARSHWTSDAWDVFVDNPPWDPDPPAADTLEHVARYLGCARIGVLILPLSYIGQPTWAPVFSPRAGFGGLHPIMPRPWVAHREAALYRWHGAGGRPRNPELFPALRWRR